MTLKEFRTKRKMTQEEFSKILGMKRQQYQRYEINIETMPLKYYKKLAKYMNVSTGFVVNMFYG